jgi:hypothetical protein
MLSYCRLARSDSLAASDNHGPNSVKSFVYLALTLSLPSNRMKALLRTDNLATILDHYHHMDQLLMIRRSPASTLLVNSKGDSISMRSIMPLHEVKTVQLKYAPEEEVEHQWVHRQHARYLSPRFIPD